MNRAFFLGKWLGGKQYVSRRRFWCVGCAVDIFIRLLDRAGGCPWTIRETTTCPRSSEKATPTLIFPTYIHAWSFQNLTTGRKSTSEETPSQQLLTCLDSITLLYRLWILNYIHNIYRFYALLFFSLVSEIASNIHFNGFGLTVNRGKK